MQDVQQVMQDAQNVAAVWQQIAQSYWLNSGELWVTVRVNRLTGETKLHCDPADPQMAKALLVQGIKFLEPEAPTESD